MLSVYFNTCQIDYYINRRCITVGSATPAEYAFGSYILGHFNDKSLKFITFHIFKPFFTHFVRLF